MNDWTQNSWNKNHIECIHFQAHHTKKPFEIYKPYETQLFSFPLCVYVCMCVTMWVKKRFDWWWYSFRFCLLLPSNKLWSHSHCIFTIFIVRKSTEFVFCFGWNIIFMNPLWTISMEWRRIMNSECILHFGTYTQYTFRWYISTFSK